MLQQKVYSLLKPNNLSVHYRFLSSTNILCLIQKWRKERGLPLNPNSCGVLTDSPDYSFLDGRLTPYGTRQKNRILKEKEVLGSIINLSKEIDFAVARHEQMQIDEENRKKAILDKKLKPKGVELLKSKK